ncbi:hypothetical protein ABZ930_05815 [Streptomyces sp. NPDC046716]|uniref:hypothetical protein n=1 Tax=Streptomyces sp. NPDC046716 TaxID=3157093 RepID=UPI0033F97386
MGWDWRTGMDVLSVVLGVAGVVVGCWTVATGRLPTRRRRGAVKRPRLWGISVLCWGLFLATQVYGLRDWFEAEDWRFGVRAALAVLGFVALLASGPTRRRRRA